MKNQFLFIVACLIMVVSCTSKIKEAPLSHEPVMTKSYKYGWNVSIIINNPGTRSEGRTFSLYYKKIVIPYVFETVYAGGQTFIFKQRVNLWDSAGYVPVDAAELTVSQEQITQNELNQGYYLGSYWKKGTPHYWCAIMREQTNAVINPEKLNDFLSHYNWKPFSILHVELVPASP